MVFLKTYEQMKEQAAAIMSTVYENRAKNSQLASDSGARVSDFLLLGMWSNSFWSINAHQQGAELQSQDRPRQQNQSTLPLRIRFSYNAAVLAIRALLGFCSSRAPDLGRTYRAHPAKEKI
jgi:hypothetical protein